MPISLAWTAVRRNSVACLLVVAGLAHGLVSALRHISTALHRHHLSAAWCVHLVGAALAGVLGVCALGGKAVRRHPLSVSATVILVMTSASLVGVSVPLALLLWALVSLVSLATWSALEPFVLRRLGCRPPSRLERERIDPALGSVRIAVVVVDAAEPWLGRGAGSVVLSRALLDLLEDRALAGLLSQASEQVRAAGLAGELVVWLGNLPVLGAWCLDRVVMQLGRVLAIAVGSSLVLPMALWPVGFTRWAGRLFGTAIVTLLGSALLSSGLSAAGLGMLLAWALVPALQTLLNRETRLAECAADDATLAAGLGWELLEALETLAWADSLPPPAAPLGWLCRLAAPVTTRIDRLWRTLSQP